MQLTGERNIRFASAAAPAVAPAPACPGETAGPATDGRRRKVTRAPVEEMRARILAHGTMEPIPDGLAALMLQEQRWETVQPNGIAFDLAGTTHRYWHEESRVCAGRVGERVLITYDRDNLDVIYVLSGDGRFEEAVPKAEGVKWFAPDMEKQIAKHRRVTARVHEALKQTHAKTTHREHDRAKANANAVQAVYDMPLPPDVQAPEQIAAAVAAEAVEGAAVMGNGQRPSGRERFGKRHGRGVGHAEAGGRRAAVGGQAAPATFGRAAEVRAAQEAILGQMREFERRTAVKRERAQREGGEVDELLAPAVAGARAGAAEETDGAELDELM